MTSSTQIVFESFLTCCPTGAPRAMRYFSSIVFSAGVIADAYLVEAQQHTMHYVAQATPELLLDWMQHLRHRHRQQRRQQQQQRPNTTASNATSHEDNDPPLAGIFIRDPDQPSMNVEQQQRERQAELHRANQAAMEAPNDIPFSSSTRVKRQAAAAAAASSSPTPAPTTTTTTQANNLNSSGSGSFLLQSSPSRTVHPEEQNQLPSHSFLNSFDVEMLIKSSTASAIRNNSSNTAVNNSHLWTGVLFLVDFPRDNFVFNLCECSWFGGKLSAVTYRVALRQLDDAHSGLAEKCDVVLPGAVSAVEADDATATSSPSVVTVTPDSQERIRITKILSTINTPVVRFLRELAGRDFTHMSGKFYLLFCPEERKQMLATTPQKKSNKPSQRQQQQHPSAQDWISPMQQQYSKPSTLNRPNINWNPVHRKATASKQQQPHRLEPLPTTSILTANNDHEQLPPGEWYFVGAQGMQQQYRAAVADFLLEQRPERLHLMHLIEEEEREAAAAAAAANKRQEQHLQDHHQQHNIDNHNINSIPVMHERPDSPIIAVDDDDISWDPAVHRTGSRAGSAHNSDAALHNSQHLPPPPPPRNGSANTPTSRPPRPASHIGSELALTSYDNSAIATRASSAATPQPRTFAQRQQLHNEEQQQFHANTSVVHRGEQQHHRDHSFSRMVVPGALVVSDLQQQTNHNNSLSAVPTIQEMWERRLRDGGPRRALMTSGYEVKVRRQHQQQLQPLDSIAARNNNNRSLVVASHSAPSFGSPGHANYNTLTHSEIASKQLRLSPGTTFGPVPTASKKLQSSKFLSRLSRFLDDENDRLVQKQLALEQREREAERAAELAEMQRQQSLRNTQSSLLLSPSLMFSPSQRSNNNNNASMTIGSPNSLRRSGPSRRQLMQHSSSSSMLMSPLEKIKLIYDVNGFYQILETAYLDLFSEKLDRVEERPEFSGKLNSSGSSTNNSNTTSKRVIRISSAVKAREVVDFMADLGIMAEYEVDKSDPLTDSDDVADAEEQDQASLKRRRDSSLSPSPADPQDQTEQQQQEQQQEQKKDKMQQKQAKKKPTPLQLALAGCAQAALITLHIPDNSRVGSRILATTLWKAESTQRTLDKLSRWQLDTMWHMYEHGTATLHRCLELVLFQQDPTNSTSAAAAAAIKSPSESRNDNNNPAAGAGWGKVKNRLLVKGGANNNKAAASDALLSEEQQEQQRKKAEEEAERKRKAAEEAAAAMKAHAARLMEIQAILSEEEGRRTRIVHGESAQRTLITGAESEHSHFLKALFPEWIAAAAVATRQRATSDERSPALSLLAEAAVLKEEIELENKEQRQRQEAMEGKFRMDVVSQEIDARLEIGKAKDASKIEAASQQRNRERQQSVDEEEKSKRQQLEQQLQDEANEIFAKQREVNKQHNDEVAAKRKLEADLEAQEKQRLQQQQREEKEAAERKRKQEQEQMRLQQQSSSVPITVSPSIARMSQAELDEDEQFLRSMVVIELMKRQESVARGNITRAAESQLLQLTTLFCESLASDCLVLLPCFVLNRFGVGEPAHAAAVQKSASTSAPTSSTRRATAKAPAATPEDVAYLREAVIVETLITQEAAARCDLEAQVLRELRGSMLARFCHEAAQQQLQRPNKQSLVLARQDRIARDMMSVQRLLHEQTQDWSAIVLQAAEERRLLAVWLVTKGKSGGLVGNSNNDGTEQQRLALPPRNPNQQPRQREVTAEDLRTVVDILRERIFMTQEVVDRASASNSAAIEIAHAFLALSVSLLKSKQRQRK